MSNYFSQHHLNLPHWTLPHRLSFHRDAAGVHTTHIPAIPPPPPVQPVAGEQTPPKQSSPAATEQPHHNNVLAHETLTKFLHAFNAHYGSDQLHPYFDLVESKTCYAIYGELPGLSEKDVTVEANDHIYTVTISGEFKRPMPQKSDAPDANGHDNKKPVDDVYWHVTERRIGSFKRAFQFPADLVDMGALKASMQNGLLCVLLPKKQESEEHKKRAAEARKVQIEPERESSTYPWWFI
ncbi:HSP20-like chaperone [Apodospora peruviana]|uniref:HSP20-like chaperone n=1 Tax=Apodospora peruviana TaxID=516989 RepID=A0AAE0HU57_9PEZI|nr:HSP20-like chaperone [Apodospora peruviana]